VQDSTSPRSVKRLFRARHILLLVLSICIVVISPYLNQQLVMAQSALPSRVATGNLWQEASFPVESFEAYTSPFGPRSGDFHYGLDLAAPLGSYIRNWWGGQVVEVWEDGRCGTGMVVRSGDWEHIYCHLKGRVETANGGRYYIDREGGLQIWQGQTVPAGARIARVGMTGNTTCIGD
jgi:murein DD-endopeptidase MepM/ murein hydrolase activator NlpD